MKPDPAQQVGVARIGEDIFESWIKIDVYNSRTADKCLVQSGECSILLAQHCVISSRAAGQPAAVGVGFGFIIFGIFAEYPLYPDFSKVRISSLARASCPCNRWIFTHCSIACA